MSSKKQINANRRNARLSTGPRTEAGRKRSRVNALAHGMTARDMAVADEKPADFEQLHRGFVKAFAPANAGEREIVLNLTIAAWKLRRANRTISHIFQTEAANIEKTSDDVWSAELMKKFSRDLIKGISAIEDSVPPNVSASATFAHILRNESGQLFDKLQRHHTAAERAIFRWMVLLDRMQETRRASDAMKIRLIESH